MQRADVRTEEAGVYQYVLDILSNHDEEEASQILKALFQDSHALISMLNDDAFNLDRFRNLLLERTTIRDNIIGMLEFAQRTRNELTANSPEALLVMANMQLENYEEIRNNPPLALAMISSMKREHFDWQTAKLCHLLIEEKINALGNQNNKFHLELSEKLHQVLDIAMDFINKEAFYQEFVEDLDETIAETSANDKLVDAIYAGSSNKDFWQQDHRFEQELELALQLSRETALAEGAIEEKESEDELLQLAIKLSLEDNTNKQESAENTMQAPPAPSKATPTPRRSMGLFPEKEYGKEKEADYKTPRPW
jgi:hypothetical protein